MRYEHRAEVVNYDLARNTGGHITVGSCFAFIKPDLFSTSAFAWLGRIIGEKVSSRMSIVNLLAPGGTELAGVKFSARTFSKMDLSSITSDKSLYKADEDTVDLLLVNPLAAGSTVCLKVIGNGAPYAQHQVEIGAHGAGKLTLQDLPAGEYEVHFDTSTDAQRYCRFSVAQYKLVPLVAALKDRQLKSQTQLNMTVELTSFGTRVRGPVSIEVFDRGVRQATLKENVDNGIVKFTVDLIGEGPHSLNFQLVDDPAKTASLPIIGSRASERSKTLMNPLGTEIFASLLPSEGASLVRGLYLSEGGLTSTPLRLEFDESERPVLKTATAIDSLVILLLDPGFPRARADAPDLARVAHPNDCDEDYRGASRLFNRGLFEDSLRLFGKARAKQANPHPYYAYFEACCHAKLGRKEAALVRLKQAIVDGWKDYAHMQGDTDLELLRGDPEFESISRGGYSEHNFEDLPVNHVVALSQRPALNILVMAATIKNKPWEGWTSFVTPSNISVALENKPDYKSGHFLEMKLKVTGKSKDAPCAAYLIVKDARLLSQDKPEARLAAAMKDYVETEAKTLVTAFPEDTVAMIAPTLPRQQIILERPRLASLGRAEVLSEPDNESDWGGPSPGSAGSGAWGGLPRGGGLSEQIRARFQQEHPASGAPQQQPSVAYGSAFAPPAPAARAPQPAPAPPAQAYGGSLAEQQAVLMDARAKASLDGAMLEKKKDSAFPVPPDDELQAVQKGHEPEVLYADFVQLVDGEATLVVPLPIQDSDYIVECFVVSQFEWCSGESRFRAVADPLAEFTLPRFVGEGETASGWLHVGTRSQELSCCVYHNEKELELHLADKPFSKNDKISSPLVNLKFTGGPGVYRAVLKSRDGETVAAIEQTVDEPGKLRRRVRSVQLLQSGDSFDLSSDESVTAIRLLPGLEQSFNLLVEATADYGHACCEQTAAKILSACAMFMFSGDDRKRQEQASSIIIAGLKREETMWLRSRGFKMYPERPNEPDTHYGPLAAQYLANLALLDFKAKGMSRTLSEALESGLRMSADALTAYGISFPPQKLASLQDAYNACRFSNNGISRQALEYVRNKAGDPDKFLKEMVPNPHFGLAVQSRIEAAYAAAAMIRQRNSGDLSTALKLANHVVKSFNEQGRLYSTTDSVAAIALLAEMIQAKILGEAGKAEINGMVQNINEALKSCQEVKSIRCLKGVVAIEVERIVEEDWSTYGSQVPLRVVMERNGQAQRSFKLGDQVNLKVQLSQGYKTGDLLWLCLPDCLSRVVGGGQVKLLSLDFAGNAELEVPLAVTGATHSAGQPKQEQKLAVCVRNMFEEERGANPGLIPVSTS